MTEQPVLRVVQPRLRERRAAPRVSTVPTALTLPVAVVIGRRKRVDRSSEVYAVPRGSVECTAHPAAESSSVAYTPPCTLPIGL